ncbi:hypothetical protein, partial [uncultured Bacteroides sp.]|uniref:hypothetical protein n=1 Tax=uncultured Bacteroides sp. TaxID=162156 RepID=UPI00259BBA84
LVIFFTRHVKNFTRRVNLFTRHVKNSRSFPDFGRQSGAYSKNGFAGSSRLPDIEFPTERTDLRLPPVSIPARVHPVTNIKNRKFTPPNLVN